MLHFAEPPKDISFVCPVAKQILDRFHDLSQFRKIAIMQTQATNQLPDPLYRVQVRTVWRQEQKPESRFLGEPPVFVHGGVVVFCVVNNDSDPTPRSGAGGVQAPKERPRRHCIKFPFLPGKAKFAITQANRSKVSHAFSGGVVEKNGIFHFRGNPHGAPGAMLLKMDFINCPDVITRANEPLQFFYMPSGPRGRHGRSKASAFACETRVGGKAAGTAALSGPRRIGFSQSWRVSCHPRRLLRPPLFPSDSYAGQIRFLPVAVDPSASDAPGDHCPPNRQTRRPQNAEPNSPRFSARRRVRRQPAGMSCRGQQEELRAGDGHTGSGQSGGFHRAEQGSWILGRRCLTPSCCQYSRLKIMRNYL
jgi:hypothetical protein